MVGFIGAGRMAHAMCRGLVGSGTLKPSQVMASDPDGRVLKLWEEMGARTTQCNRQIVEESNVVVLAVKPNMVRTILRDVCDRVTKNHLIISIAAGISLDTLQQETPDYTRVVRVMPNTPALVHNGASVFSRGRHTLPDDGELVHHMFSTFGYCEEMAEKYLDAVTGLSGSGPAYMFVALEALADGGVKMGLPRDVAMRLAAKTMMGSADMVLQMGANPGALKDNVTSPSGSTISGLYELEKGGFRFCLMHAVEAASQRAYELGLIDNYDTASESTMVGKYSHVPEARPIQTPLRELLDKRKDAAKPTEENLEGKTEG